MAFASFDRQRAAAPMAEINMVPLIDVMLVLLVIFIVTAPLLRAPRPPSVLPLPASSSRSPKSICAPTRPWPTGLSPKR